MTVTGNNRIEFIDLAKGICILLVVAIHAIPELDDYLPFLPYVRMPLYFCLSGLFYKDYGSLKNFTIKKLNNILIPFVAWYIISMVIYLIGRLFFPGNHEATYYIGDFIFQNEIYNQPIWFLLSLFWSNIIFSLVRMISKKWYWEFAIIMACAAAGLIMSYFKVFNFLYIGISLTCIPFFFLGYMLKQTELLYPSNSKKREFAIMSLCMVLGMFLVFYPTEPSRVIYYSNEFIGNNYLIYYLAGIFLTVSLLLCSKFLKKIPFITWIGRFSIIILVTHMLLVVIYRQILQRLTAGRLDSMIESLMVLTLVLLSIWFVIPICKKFFPHITAQKPVFRISENDKKENYR